MAGQSLSRLSTEPIWVPVRIEHPILGNEDLTPDVVEVAIVKGEPTPSDWGTAVIDLNGTWEGPDGEEYFLIDHTIFGGTYAPGSYSLWVRITHASMPYIVRAGDIAFH